MWTGTDYNQALPPRTSDYWFAYTSGTNVISSNEWNSNGERSLKCSFNSIHDYCECHIYNLDKSKSYTASFDAYGQGSYVLQFLSNSNFVVKSANGNVNKFCKLSATITSNEFNEEVNELKIRLISTSDNNLVYTDNWSLIRF